MFNLTRNALSRRLVPRKLHVTSSRHLQESRDGEISLYKFAPEWPQTKQNVGPWPRTKEEREKAAKKYNLIPEDYEPYPEEEGWGDYPKLKAVGDYNRDKYDDFDDPWDYRFYAEPLHRDFDLYKWEKFDPLAKEKPQFLPPYYKRILVAFGIPISLYLLSQFCEKHRINFNPPYKSRKYLGGQKLYTFPYSPNDGTGPHLAHH